METSNETNVIDEEVLTFGVPTHSCLIHGPVWPVGIYIDGKLQHTYCINCYDDFLAEHVTQAVPNDPR